MPKTKKVKIKPVPKSKDLPATRGMLFEVRDELKNEFRGLERRIEARFKDHDANFKNIDARFNEVDARFNKIDARFNEIDARFNEVDARFNRIDERFDRVDARFERLESAITDLTAKVHYMGVCFEEQRADNRATFEYLQGFRELWQNHEDRIFDVEESMRWLAKTKANLRQPKKFEIPE